MSRGGALRVILAELPTVGLDPAAVCAAAQVDPRTPDDEALPFGVAELARVLARAEAMAGDDLLGLHMAERAPGRGVLAYLARAQRTVGDGLRAFARFAETSWESGAALRIEKRGAEVFVRVLLGPPLPRHAVEYVLARTAIGLRRSGAAVQEVRFRHACGGAAGEYERVLRCPVRFGQPATGLTLRAADMTRPLRTANPEAAATLAAMVAQQPAPRGASATARLTAAVEDALARGQAVQREALARALGMSGKTLARRLAAEQRRFRDIVEEVRRTQARRLVAEGDLDLGEVAARVGFADLAAFGKAFRRWYGTSASSLRSRRRA